jgi:hypothetical protein
LDERIGTALLPIDAGNDRWGTRRSVSSRKQDIALQK